MAHQKEQWRKIPKAPLYDASSDGRIMSVRHKHIIIPKEKDDGLYIDLMVKGEFMEFYVPDLVLSAFSPTYLFGDIKALGMEINIKQLEEICRLVLLKIENCPTWTKLK